MLLPAAVLLLAVFHPARAAHDWRAAVTRGDRAAAEDTGEARAATALEARANDIKQFDPAFDLEKVLGRTNDATDA